MTRELMHEEAQLALAAEALDALTGEEREAALAHIDGCPECRAGMRALRDTAAALAYAVPPAALDPARRVRVRERLVARAAADTHARTAERREAVMPLRPRDIAAPPRPRRAPWLLAAALAALMVGAAMYTLSLRHEVRVLARQVAALETARANLQRQVEAREQLLAGLTGPAVRVVELVATGAPAPSGRMFWDQATDTWTFFAHNLPAAKPGRTYQLWLITPGQRKLPAGTFAPDRGNAQVQARFPLAPDSLAAVAVTEEPAGGVPQPTGPIVLVGERRRSE